MNKIKIYANMNINKKRTKKNNKFKDSKLIDILKWYHHTRPITENNDMILVQEFKNKNCLIKKLYLKRIKL